MFDPKAELYREPPSDTWKELWIWLGDNVAVELSSDTHRYVVLLRALDSPNPKQWWWNRDDAMELGLAVDVLDEGIPRPPTRRMAALTGEPYPFAVDGTILSACLLASERLRREMANTRDARYVAICHDLLSLRQKPGGEPYALPWFMLIYRSWLAFAAQLPGFASSKVSTALSYRDGD